MNNQKLIVLCTGNSCRSQLMEAYLKKFAKKTDIFSAGSNPQGVHLFTIKALEEDGVDTSSLFSKHIDMFKDVFFDLSLSVCDRAKQVCDIHLNSKHKMHYSFADPASVIGDEKTVWGAFCETRDSIKKYAKDYCIKYDL